MMKESIYLVRLISMPENVEIHVAGEQITFYIVETVPEYHTMKNIYADATVAQAKNHPACSSAASGHFYLL